MTRARTCTGRARSRGRSRAPLRVTLPLALLVALLPSASGSPFPALGAAEVLAQQSRPGSTSASETRQEMMARIQRDFERRMSRELGLSPDEMAAVRTIMGEFRSTRGEMMRERFQLRQALERHAEAGGSEAEARRLLDRSRALRAREVDVQRSEEDRLLEVLSVSQLLRLHQLREDFSESIRRMEAQAGARRGGPPGGQD
ncbi:MAG: hypothetical protein EA350_02025 [Gemmatimonadales bacterium]|nr:MAG: hypothetical protein EA350_02025 [Gemmatimonadales bacterium]